MTDHDDDDLRAIYGPGEVPTEGEPASQPEPEPEPPEAEPTEPAPIVSWDATPDVDAAPPPAPPAPPEGYTPPDEPAPIPRRRWGVAAAAAALSALFFVPWFNAGGLLASSGAALVAWTEGVLADRAGSQFGGAFLVPYLAVLIPAGALAVLVQVLRRRPVRLLAIGTALVAPLLLVYAVARAGSSVFKVLDVGAYLTLVGSLALVVAALVGRRSSAVRGFIAGAFAVLVLAAFVIPQVAQDDVDSRYFAAFARGDTTLAETTAPRQNSEDSGTASEETTTTTAVEVALPGVTSTSVAPTSTTAASAHGTSGGCPTRFPTAQIDSFSPQQQSAGSTSYVVDIEGTVLNRSSASIDVSNISVVVLRDRTQVGGDSIDAGRTLVAGQNMQFWSRGLVVQSPDGPPTSAEVASLAYAWNDPRLSSCPR